VNRAAVFYFRTSSDLIAEGRNTSASPRLRIAAVTGLRFSQADCKM